MLIQIFGPGCSRCHATYDAISSAVKTCGLSENISIEKVTDPIAMMQAGVMATPAVAIDGKVVVSGRVVSLNEAATLIVKEMVAGEVDAAGGCCCGACSCGRHPD